MSPNIEHKWDGEVFVSYKLLLTPDKFKTIITASESPIAIHKELLPNEYLLKHKKYDPQQPMVSGLFHPTELEESPLVRTAMEELRFEPTYEIGQEWNYEDPHSMQVYRDLRDMLQDHRVPYFIIVEDEGPKTSIIAGGRNPEMNLRLDNQRPDIFPL